VGRRRQGKSGGEGRWLSGLWAAAPEILLDAESGSADRGVPSGSKDNSAKQKADDMEGGEDRDAAPPGRAAWTHRAQWPGDPEHLSDIGEIISASSAREAAAKDERNAEKKGKREEERRG